MRWITPSGWQTALREFGANLGEGYRAFALEDRKMIRLGVPPNMVDILNFAGEDLFEEVWSGRVQVPSSASPSIFLLERPSSR